MNWGGRERERAEFSPRRNNNFPREASHSFFFSFFFYIYNMYNEHIYIMYILNIFTVFTHIQHPLTSGPGGAPVGQPLQVPGGIALSQPRQHPSNKIE